MSINKMQLQSKQDEIIIGLLQKGINATSYEVSSRLTEFFDRKPPGLPYFTPIQIQAHDTSDVVPYNEMFKSLSNDLDLLYKANVDQNNKILIMEEYYLAEKNKVQSTIDKLDLRLNNLQDTVSSLKVSQSYCQVFDNFYDIDFVGDHNRNIPNTTAFVDLLQKKVSNDKLSLVSDKHDISAATIVISELTNYVSLSPSGDIKTILTDSINNFYIYNVNTATDGKFSISLLATLINPIDASSVMIRLSSSNTITAFLSFSTDGVTYTDTYSVSGTSDLEWNFDNSSMRYIKIALSKDEADAFDGTEYQYYYVLKNISIINETFINKGIFVSKPIEFNDAIDTLTLTTNDLVFPNTNIFYYIGLDNGVDKVSWENIIPGESFDLGILDSKTKIVNNKDVGFGAVLNNNLYSIFQLPANTNLNTVEVTSGYQMWYLESIPYAVPNYKLTVNEYVRTNINRTQHIDSDIYKMTLNKGTIYVMTQHVYCDNDTVLNNKNIKSDILNGVNTDSYLQTMLIVNNNTMISVGNGYSSYAIRLKAGRNKIQILMFVSTAWTNPTFKIEHNINFKEYSHDTFSEIPMKHISYYNLLYKTPSVIPGVASTLSTNFAVDINNKIIVKNDPTVNCINSNFSNSGIRYLLKYKTLTKKAINKLTVNVNNPVVKFRVMASLLSSNEDVSPQIINYRIVGV